MTRDETKKIIMVVVASYPNWKPNDLSFTVDAWHMMLSEYNYNDIALALKAYITTDTSGFAPSIGQLVNSKFMVERLTGLNELEAWDMVSKALRDSTYHAEERFAQLPELVQRCVGSPSQLRNWGQSDIKSVETVIQSNFMRTFREMKKRDDTIKALPVEMKEEVYKRLQEPARGKLLTTNQ